MELLMKEALKIIILMERDNKCGMMEYVIKDNSFRVGRRV